METCENIQKEIQDARTPKEVMNDYKIKLLKQLIDESRKEFFKKKNIQNNEKTR